MDPFSWLMLAINGASLADQLLTEPPTNVVGAPQPGGTGQGAFVDAYAQTTPQAKAPPTPEELALDNESLEATAKALSDAMGPPPQVAPLQAPNVGEPGSAQQGPPVSRANPGVEGAAPATNPQASIGEVLAASPEAIASMANLLGLGPQPGTQRRPAPIPGGTAGRVVQGFTAPRTPDIGTLLASIPRFR